MRIQRLAVVALLPIMLTLSPVTFAEGTGGAKAKSGTACAIANLRLNYAKTSLAITAAGHQKIVERSPPEDLDLEDEACISDYGLKGGFGLPSLAGGLLDGLMDKVCAAADSYLASNLEKFTASITSPLGLGDVDLGIGVRDPGDEDDPDKPRDPFFNMTERENEVGVDFGDMIDDQFEKMPEVDDGYTDYSYESDSDVTDYDYATKQSKAKKAKKAETDESGARR